MVTVRELRAGVYQLDLGSVNAYLAADDELTLVDAGTPRDATAIRRGIDEAGYGVGDVGRVLVTHFDVDHVGALDGLALDAPVYMGAPDVGAFTGAERPTFRNLKGAIQRSLSAFVDPPETEPQPVADGDTVGSVRVYHTPGHTPGHVAYVSEELSVAFVGDLVVESDGELDPSTWYLSYDTDRVRDSIHELADRAPAVEVLAMGHGVPFVRDGSVRLAELGERIEGGPVDQRA
jgi:glyoxylase-like metal-dependent hydrolase (beta-lactamase superfamily II)